MRGARVAPSNRHALDRFGVGREGYVDGHDGPISEYAELKLFAKASGIAGDILPPGNDVFEAGNVDGRGREAKVAVGEQVDLTRLRRDAQ